ncbi:MAG: flagellar export protein FliJ [Methylomonas sp.]|nr:flagellar export protein FliJ [Methylomonas sp.]PPD22432.1 MAG: flagellar export protein FliJ [Methylomonas sp.]PPD24866.1 MAG: flagellar export protein FliJ [Methylomonas sp.]PPD33732.1 MAG: flagellar export protein FliJ [Methylomonas sp.]PPD42074.1 MAG: flagellar export protein FliJ [Methylomonas sp.]
MKKSDRFNIIIALHDRQERSALEALARVQQTLHEQQAKLSHLQNYRLEYADKLIARQRLGLHVSQLLEYRAFSDKLDKAIDGQRQSVVRHERDVLAARQYWEDCQQRRKSLQKVKEMALSEERRLEDKREQAEQDAHATRLARKDGMGNA